MGARGGRTIVAVCLLVGAALTTTAPAGADPPDSTLVPCTRAAERVVLTASAHLDPSCTYTGGPTSPRPTSSLTASGAAVSRARRRRRRHRGAHAGRRVDGRRHRAQLPRRRLPQRHPRHPRRLSQPGRRRGVRAELRDVVIEDSTHQRHSAAWGSTSTATSSEVTIRHNTHHRRRKHRHLPRGRLTAATSSQATYIARQRLQRDGQRQHDLRFVGTQTFRFWGIGREGLAVDGSLREPGDR